MYNWPQTWQLAVRASEKTGEAYRCWNVVAKRHAATLFFFGCAWKHTALSPSCFWSIIQNKTLSAGPQRWASEKSNSEGVQRSEKGIFFEEMLSSQRRAHPCAFRSCFNLSPAFNDLFPILEWSSPYAKFLPERAFRSALKWNVSIYLFF